VKASLFGLFERLHGLWGSAALAGAAAGGLNTALSCPADVLKSRLQVQVVVAANAANVVHAASAAAAADGRTLHASHDRAGISRRVCSAATSAAATSAPVAATAGYPSGYEGPLRTLRGLVGNGRGWRGLYVGWAPLACRDVLGYAVLFSVCFTSLSKHCAFSNASDVAIPTRARVLPLRCVFSQ